MNKEQYSFDLFVSSRKAKVASECDAFEDETQRDEKRTRKREREREKEKRHVSQAASDAFYRQPVSDIRTAGKNKPAGPI
jgi:hypothetical protein